MSNIAFIPLLFTKVSFTLAKIITKLKISFISTLYIVSLALIDLYILLDFFQLLFFYFSGSLL